MADDRLARVTTEYDGEEDRIRLSGTVDEKRVVVIWLTQRLLRRLLPALFEWLGRPAAGLPRAEVMQGVAQQRAVARMTPEPPVRAAGGGLGWVASSIDVKRGDAGAQLTFRGRRPGERAIMVLTPLHARQWLAIVQAGFHRAGWSLDDWPEWLTESGLQARPPSVVLH